MKLSKSAIRKALKGWGASGPNEVSQEWAIEVCYERILNCEAGTKIFYPIGGYDFIVDGASRSIVRRDSKTGDVEEVFVFEVK